MNSNEGKSQLNTIYLGNTRTISLDSLLNYCSKFGVVLECSRRLLSVDQTDLVDFTFIRFLTEHSTKKFLSISSHLVERDIVLDVRAFNEILHSAVPLHVDRKIVIRHLPNHISLNDVKKYFRAFGSIKQTTSEIDANEQRSIYVEFESAASRNKLLKGKIHVHRIRAHSLTILPFLRPTDVDLYRIETDNLTVENPSNIWIEFERDYSLNISDDFHRIERKISDFFREQRDLYAQLRNEMKS